MFSAQLKGQNGEAIWIFKNNIILIME